MQRRVKGGAYVRTCPYCDPPPRIAHDATDVGTASVQLSSVCLRTNERSAKRFRRVSRTCTVCACARSCVDTVTTETHLTAVRSLEAVDRRDSVADKEGRSSPREANLENEACEDGRTSQAASTTRAPLRAWLGAIVRQPEFADP